MLHAAWCVFLGVFTILLLFRTKKGFKIKIHPLFDESTISYRTIKGEVDLGIMCAFRALVCKVRTSHCASLTCHEIRPEFRFVHIYLDLQWLWLIKVHILFGRLVLAAGGPPAENLILVQTVLPC